MVCDSAKEIKGKRAGREQVPRLHAVQSLSWPGQGGHMLTDTQNHVTGSWLGMKGAMFCVLSSLHMLRTVDRTGLCAPRLHSTGCPARRARRCSR